MNDTLSSAPKNLPEGAKVIYGQAWISKDSLVQDQILLLSGGKMCENTVELLENIWDDLTSDTGKVKTNDKGYFYWEITMTDSMNDDLTHTVKIEAPKPKPGLFTDPENDLKKAKSDWAKYWLEKMSVAVKNYEKAYAIQKKEISLPGSTYINQNGEEIIVADQVIQNSALGDIENLLSIF